MDSERLMQFLSLFLSQWLVHSDVAYTQERVYADLAREKDQIWKLTTLRCHPEKNNDEEYQQEYSSWKPTELVLQLAKEAVASILKTNFFSLDETKAFRFDTSFFPFLPKSLQDSFFPQAPFALFYIVHERYFGFHIRFQDIARGGLRSVLSVQRKGSILLECYQLAWTQEKKNKDIAEGGSKGILFVDSSDLLHDAQKGYAQALLSVVNGDSSGRLFRDDIVDYYKRPEYIYLGPDENMHDSMIDWIANYSISCGYYPQGAFITGKLKAGINHKKYGVTSYGVHQFLEKVLCYLGLERSSFSVKMTGGPDGDVAGNVIVNLHKYYSDRALIVALTDISGTVVDPNGLDLKSLCGLFYEGKSIRYYPFHKLSSSGFLLQKDDAQLLTAHAVQAVSPERCLEVSDKAVHEASADIFIPAGGRPNTLNEKTVHSFFDAEGKPTALAIIEGANVYCTQGAREELEKRGVIVIKDASANKGGVISSSYEVLSSLVLSEEEFLMHKEQLVQEILEKIKQFSGQEAELLLSVHDTTGQPCSKISSLISDHILAIRAAIREVLVPMELPSDSEDPLYIPFFAYCLPLLCASYKERLMSAVPDAHKKAIIATSLGAQLVYRRYFSLPRALDARLLDYCHDRTLFT